MALIPIHNKENVPPPISATLDALPCHALPRSFCKTKSKRRRWSCERIPLQDITNLYQNRPSPTVGSPSAVFVVSGGALPLDSDNSPFRQHLMDGSLRKRRALDVPDPASSRVCLRKGFRYHILVIEKDSFPSDVLELAAWTEDGLIMAARHKKHKHIQGVQFRPESIMTPGGKTIVRNFIKLMEKMEQKSHDTQQS